MDNYSFVIQGKKLKFVFVALATFLGVVSLSLPQTVKAGVPYIKDVYYLSPTTMVMKFTESMNTSTIGVDDFELYTEAGGDSEAIDHIQFLSIEGGTNNAIFIIASGARISPSYSDYIKVVGTIQSSTGDILDEPYPWQPVIPKTNIVISEVQTSGGTTTDEFIELYNRSDQDIDLSSYQLVYADVTGTEYILINKTQFAGAQHHTVTKGGGYYLVANSDYDGPTAADITYANTKNIPDADGTIILYKEQMPGVFRVIDIVGYGHNSSVPSVLREGDQITAGAELSSGGSIERKAISDSTAATMAPGGANANWGNAYDSNNNDYDFVIQTLAVPQNASSTPESPHGFGAGVGGDKGIPMIMHMALWQAKISTDLKIIARMTDAETPYNSLGAKLYYKPAGGAWATSSGVHIANGYFKFSIPASAIPDTNGFKYYLKASDGTNCRYMSASSTADMVNTGLCTSTEPAAIRNAAWQVNGATWTAGTDITGYVYQSDGSTPIADALVFAEGTGFWDLTASSGAFTLSDVYPGSYNLVAVVPGYMDQYMSGVEAGATWPQFIMYSGGGGSGGDVEKPRVVWSEPMDGMSGMPVDISLNAKPIVIGFDKEMDSSTINSNNIVLQEWDATASVMVAFNGTTTVNYYIPGDTLPWGETAGDYMAVLSAATPLVHGKDYQIVLYPSVKDTSGNPLSGNRPEGGHKIWFNTGFASGEFTQGGGAMPPFVMGSLPKPGMFGVPINSKIFIRFTEPIDSGSLNSNTIQLWKLNSSMQEVSQVSASLSLEPNEKELVIVTPLANLSSDTNYRIKVRGDVQATNGMYTQYPEDPDFPAFIFNAEFTTWDSTNPDITAPTVTGYGLDMYKDASGNVVNVPVSLGNIEIFFSEGINPTTVNSTDITLKAGTSQVSGDVEYDPMAKSARFYPNTALVPNTTYTLTVKGGAIGIKDARFPGTALASDATYTFKTGGADTIAPKVMFGEADDFRIAITFSEPMNNSSPGQPQYNTSVLNKANYAIKYKGPDDSNFLSAPQEELTNLMISYDDGENTAMLEGLDFYAHRGHEFKVIVTNVTDRSGNAIDTTGTPPANVARGTIRDSADTGGMLGPGGAGMMGPTGGGMDFAAFGMKPCGAWPMNMMEGMMSHYSVDLPTSKALQDGDQVLLTFPAGFEISNAVPVPTAESQVNSDFNDVGPGTVTFDTTFDGDGVKAEGQTVIVQLDISGTTTLPAQDFLHFDIKGIKNGKAQGTDTLNSEGYSVNIKTKRPSTGAIVEEFTTMPFFLTPGGNLSIGGTITMQGGDASTDGTVQVFMGSPLTGPVGTTATIADGAGTYQFKGLPSGDYDLFTKPFVTVGGMDFLGDPTPKHIFLGDTSITNQNIIFKKAGGTSTTKITVRLKGTFKTAGSPDKIDIFAGSQTMTQEGGFAVKPGVTPGPGSNGVCSDFNTPNCSFSLYLPTVNESRWYVGIGPAMPMGPMNMGPPPAIDWMPPAEQEVYIDAAGNVDYPGDATSVDISISAAEEKILGYVYDGKPDGINDLGTSNDYGKPVKDIDIEAHKREGFGMPAHTRSGPDGGFSLSVTTGTFFLSAWKPGMPPTPEKKVLVKDESQLNDANPASDVYINGSIPVTTAAPLVFKLGKSGFTISGVVSDGSNPVAYAPVWAWNEDTGMSVPSGTDQAGNFTLYVSPGTWKIQAHVPGYGDLPPVTKTVNNQSISNLILKPLSGGVEVSGTVTVGGSAQGGADVRIEGTDSEGNFFQNGGPTRADGTYNLVVPPGTGYKLYSWIPNYGDQAPIDIGTINAGQTPITGKDFTVNTTNTVALSFKFNNSVKLDGREAIVSVHNPSNDMGQDIHISNINDVQDYEKLQIVAGDYEVRAHIPGFGEFEPSIPAPDPTTHLVTFSAGTSSVTFDLPAAGYTVSGKVYVDMDGDGAYTDGTDTLITNGFVWLASWDSGFHSGGSIDNTGSYSIFVPAGTFYLGVDAPGYTGPAPEKIEDLSANLTNKNIAVVADTYTISGTVYAGDSTSGVPYAWVWAEKVDAAHVNNPTEATLLGHKHVEADKDGHYELSVSAGYWWIHAIGPGYKETFKDTAVAASSSPTNYNLSLNPITGFKANSPESKSIKPSEGGTMAAKFGQTVVKATIPPTALGDSTDYGKIIITEKTGGNTDAKATLGTRYYDIKAYDSSNAPIAGQLDAPITLTIKYDPSNLPEGFKENQLSFGSMNEEGQWEEDMFTVNGETNTMQVKLTHLSAVAVNYPADVDRPSTPGTPTVLAGDGQVSLSWAASTDNVAVAGYEVYRSTSTTGTFVNISGDCESGGSFDSSVLVTSTSYTDATAQNGTTYYYKVSAYDTSGLASASPSPASEGATPFPSAPSSVSASAVSAKGINVSWSSVSGVLGYNVYRSATDSTSTATKLGDSTPTISGASNTSYSDTGLSAGVTYYYWIRAYVNANSISNYSSSASATTQAEETAAPATVVFIAPPPAPVKVVEKPKVSVKAAKKPEVTKEELKAQLEAKITQVTQKIVQVKAQIVSVLKQLITRVRAQITELQTAIKAKLGL